MPLSINPRVLGPVIDETGCIATGKLVFAPEAWEQFLGRDMDTLVVEDLGALKTLEERIVWIRVTLVVGWAAKGEEGWEGVGRLCVLAVRE